CKSVVLDTPSPRDPASGQTTGRRTYRPLTLVGDWGPALPRLFGALTAHEVLPKVELRFFPPSKTEPSPAYVVQISDVSVTNILHDIPKNPVSGPRVIHSNLKADTEELTRVKFAYEKILLTFGTSKKSSTDDWVWTG
ncbi:MAG TPA: type VI secretion system tube protein Hcp, partial [Planctomycetota bacterium]|nr:type VI secretion system tube protein Hcp [Planctomycetota bacterium]